MKKIITTLLFLLLVFGLFAETGYNKRAWLTKKGNLNLQFATEQGNDELWQKTEVEKKPIIGSETLVYYHFLNDYFFAVSYFLPLEKTEKVKSKFKELIYSTPSYSLSKDEYANNMLAAGVYKDLNEVDLKLNKTFTNCALDLELNGRESISMLVQNNGKGLISIYDYNDDTRVYLFENFLKDITIVVYTYHEQDY